MQEKKMIAEIDALILKLIESFNPDYSQGQTTMNNGAYLVQLTQARGELLKQQIARERKELVNQSVEADTADIRPYKARQ